MPTIKTDFVISGEKQYKQAISEINSGLGVLGSEMKKVTAQYQDNANSVEALTAKGDVLERTLLSQKEKVEELRRALANAKEQYGEADKRTMEWEKSLNLAEAAVANTESAIRKNNEALERAKSGMQETGSASSGLSSRITDLASQFGVKLPGGLDKALGSMKGFSAGAVTAVGAVAVAVAALAKAEKQLVDLTRETAASADDILTLSQITGLNTDTIQEMQYASQLIDVSFETIQSSLTKLKNNMQDARGGNEKLAETFRTLKVEVTNADGSLRDSEAVFYDVIDALGGIENQTERDTIAMDIFGKKAEDLNPLIIQGSDTLRKYADEAHNVNYVLSEESLDALGKVDDAYQRMQQTQEATRRQMAEEMAPAVEELYTKWTNYISGAGERLQESGMIEGAADILSSVVDIIPALEELTTAVIPDLGEGLSGIAQIVNTISWAIAGIADLIEFIEGMDPWNWGSGKMKNALGFGYAEGNPSHIQAWEMKSAGGWDSYQERYNGKPSPAQSSGGSTSTGSSTAWTMEDYARYSWDEASQRWYDNVEHRWIQGYATGTMHFMGGRITVGENGPETVDLPEGSRIWNAQESRMGAGSGGVTINGDVILDASKVEDLVDAAKFLSGLRVVRRMK